MYACRWYDDPQKGETYRTPLVSNGVQNVGTQRHRIFVDSRDCVQNLSSFSFTVYLSDPFRDASIGIAPFERVQTIELKALAFPKINDDFVIMDVLEANDERMHSPNQTANKSFAVVYFDTTATAVGEIKPVKGNDFFQRDIAFNPPIPKLTKLTVSFRKRDNAVITPADTASVNHCSFMLEITTLVHRSLASTGSR